VHRNDLTLTIQSISNVTEEEYIFQELLALFVIVVYIFDALRWRNDINTKYPVISTISNKICWPCNIHVNYTLPAYANFKLRIFRQN